MQRLLANTYFRICATIRKSRNQKEDTYIEPCVRKISFPPDKTFLNGVLTTLQHRRCHQTWQSLSADSPTTAHKRPRSLRSTVELMVESVSSIPPCMPILLTERRGALILTKSKHGGMPPN